jgi:hypothetical protein
MFADQSIETHQQSFPAGHRRFWMSLDKVADNCSFRHTVEKNNLFHREGAVEYNLVYIRSPSSIRLVIKFNIKVEVGFLPG